VRQLLQVVL